jgi:flagellar biosynthetic protein FliR
VTATLPVDLLLGFLLAVVRTTAWLAVAPPFNTRMVPATAKVGLAVALAVPIAPRLAPTAPPPEVAPLVAAVLLRSASDWRSASSCSCCSPRCRPPVSSSTCSPASRSRRRTTRSPTPTRRSSAGSTSCSRPRCCSPRTGTCCSSRGCSTPSTPCPRACRTSGAASTELLDSLALFFLSAIEIAVPLLGALFLTEVALGLLSKAAPQMNVFVLGFPIKIMLTLLLAGLALPLLPNAVEGLVRAATTSGAAIVAAFT